MSLALPSLHADLTFTAPLSEARAARLVDFVARDPAGDDLDGTVVDTGCGWAELLLRTLEAAPRARGLGIDLDHEAVAHGRRLADRRGLADRARLVVGDVREHLPTTADAAICVGASQIWGPPVEAEQPLDYRATLTVLRALVGPGARVVYGEAVWSAPPTEAATVHLAGRPDELVAVPELLELAVDAGFAPVQVHEATGDEWDEFESGFAAGYARWLAAHPADHPDAAQVRERAAWQRTAYFSGYRGVLGMAYLALLAV